MSDRLLKESDVLKAIDKRIEVLSKDPEFVQKNGIIDIIGIKKYILAIPSVDRPKGEWNEVPIDDWNGITIVPWYKCTVCGVKSMIVSPYCPNCGADMRGNGK